MSMRRALAAIALVFVGQAAYAAGSGERVPFLGGFIQETRIVYPLSVDGWSANGEKRYDDPEHGVSVRYVRDGVDDRWIDVFFYPVGVVTPAEVAKIVQHERDSLAGTWAREPNLPPELSPLRTFDFPRALAPEARDAGSPVVPANAVHPARPVANGGDDAAMAGEETGTAHSMDLVFGPAGKRRNSAMVMAASRMYMVKTRFSVLGDAMEREAVRAYLERFTTDLVRSTGIDSTGACWQPLPVSALPPGQPPPEGAVLTLSQDGVATTFVYADRVLARDPTSPAAQVAITLGMVRAGRSYDGCVDSRPRNPSVPEGSREIRIEYRVPGGDAPPAPRLRTVRTGLG
jgi:hypothetical protein